VELLKQDVSRLPPCHGILLYGLPSFPLIDDLMGFRKIMEGIGLGKNAFSQEDATGEKQEPWDHPSKVADSG
jgi:hypothetical protein